MTSSASQSPIPDLRIGSEDRRKAPAFSFYPNDFASGIRMFSLAERGAYISLLCHQWDHGAVPDNAVDRARILGCSLREADKAWTRVRQKFDQGPDGAWRNARLEAERDKQQARRNALANNGSKGGRPRHTKANDNQQVKQTETNSFSSGLANDNQKQSLSFSSSSSTPVVQRAELPGGDALARARPTHPAQQHGLQTLHRGSHRSHAWCSERICVPDFQHEKFVRAVGGPHADAELRALYDATVAGIPDAQPIESDPLKFWPPVVSARWPPQSAQVGTRTAALQRATAEFVRRGQ